MREAEFLREYSFVTCNVDNVIVETIKHAEDSNDIIVRAFETYNRRTRTELIFDLPISRVWECNLMEE
ncbi:glycosyl hydrolase-related protein, partial [Anaerosporobacter sp.]|uniref:glycosyl hydrolase-related protein n=1 Tax=Anaerosporobacter sp. TaxID=1872529 RepID=UPI00289E907A